jgi:hypothetical protein
MVRSYCRTILQAPGTMGDKPLQAGVLKFRVLSSLIFFLLQFPILSVFGQASLLDKPISIDRQHTTLYDALNIISGKAGCLFIYDSRLVENDRRVKLEAVNEPLKHVLNGLINNPELGYKVIGQHILIYRIKKPQETVIQTMPPIPAVDSSRQLIIKGNVYDHLGNKPVPYASVGILEENMGTITNADGYFVLKVPARYAGSSLLVSHMGYMSREIPIELLDEQKVDIFLERRIISLQEVIIRYIDPVAIISKAMQQRSVNNANEPVYMTTFYREGVRKNERYISYSEAVFKVYKSSFRLSESADQIKLLKSRKVQNTSQKDTVMLKLKAGILSGLQLDIVKSIPDFLDLTDVPEYTYTYSDMVSYNDRDAYAITFIQDKGIEDALYTGTLYVDNENFAILGANFEINPAYLDKAVDNLVLKKSRKLSVKLEKISYSVSYSRFNGRYYLNHARCDLNLRTHLRNHLSSDNFTTFLEVATCHIDTLNVARFEKEEVLKPNVVFSDIPYVYDDSFWGDYNIIVPEEKLNEALSRINRKIEEME